MLNQCLESLVQKVQSGVVINFEKTGPDPPLTGEGEFGGDTYSVLSMHCLPNSAEQMCKREKQLNKNCSHRMMVLTKCSAAQWPCEVQEVGIMGLVQSETSVFYCISEHISHFTQ